MNKMMLRKPSLIVFAAISILLFAGAMILTMLTNHNKLWLLVIPVLINYFLGMHLFFDLSEKQLYWFTYGMLFVCGASMLVIRLAFMYF